MMEDYEFRNVIQEMVAINHFIISDVLQVFEKTVVGLTSHMAMVDYSKEVRGSIFMTKSKKPCFWP